MGLDCCFGVFQSLFIIFLVMAEGGTAEAAKEAMKFTFLHWGFMPGQCMHW
jgi:choline-glycine betaine transporter